MFDRRSFGVGATLILGGLLFGGLVSSPSMLDYAVLTAYYALLAGSWNLLAGFTGQLSFAHVGLAAVGAYMTIVLTDVVEVSAGLALPLAGVATAVAGFGLGLVSMRVRGIHLALITFAFAGAFQVVVNGWYSLTGGATGHMSQFLFSGVSRTPYVWLGLALVVAYFLCQRLVLESRFGVQAMALRDREEVAEGLGVRTTRVKIGMFTLTAFWAGVAGSYFAGYNGIVDPAVGSLTNMGLVVAMVVVGGFGRRLAPIAGVIILQVITYYVTGYGAEYTMLIFSGLVLIVMLVTREGIVPMAEKLLRRVRPDAGRWDATEPDAGQSRPAPKSPGRRAADA